MPEAILEMNDCLARVREGDEEAGRALVGHLYPLVMKIVRSHLPRRMDEEDLAQIVFLKMFSHIHQYRGQVPFEHWVSRISVNTCLNQLRTEKCRPEIRAADMGEEETQVLERVLAVSTEPEPGDALASREIVERMLQTLSPADRLVVTMLDLQGLSIEEVRQATGWSLSLVKVRAFRARLKLRKQLGKLRHELL